MCVSARSEWQLGQLRRLGVVRFQDGATEVEATGTLTAEQAQTVQYARDNVLGPLGGTGVLAAMTAAVQLRPPTVVFPVQSLDMLLAVPVMGEARWRDSGVLAEPVLLRPDSRTEDLHAVLCRPPLAALAGDYVRAEYLTAAGARQLLRKDEVLAPGTIACVMTNRKVAWQRDKK